MKDLGQRLLALKQQIETTRSALDQAQGRLAGLNERLNKEFKCASLEEADALATRLEQEAKALEVEVETGLLAAEQKWNLG